MATKPSDTERLPLRVFIEFGSYHCLNVGDLAMLQVVVARLRKRYPQATVHVTNAAPERLRRACPDVIAVMPEPSENRGDQGYLPASVRRVVTSGPLRRPRLRPLRRVLASTTARPPYQREPDGGSHGDVLEVLREADLVLVSGGGAMTDAFLPHPLMILDRLELGTLLGKVTAMVGQGIGPIGDPLLAARMRAVLPSVDLIALRERRAGAPLLQTFGVSPERLHMTGDDAIELAYEHARISDGTNLANAVGVNLRRAEYSGVSPELAMMVAEVLGDHARRRASELLPVPISHHPGESDATTLGAILGGDGGAALQTPLEVIEQVARCRLVVTGSYHAAVFAVAQGIPAVGLSGSAYYADKFGGLADLFPEGCSVVALDAPDARERLAAAVERGWDQATATRTALLSAAERQVDASRAAFMSLESMVDQRVASR